MLVACLVGLGTAASAAFADAPAPIVIPANADAQPPWLYGIAATADGYAYTRQPPGATSYSLESHPLGGPVQTLAAGLVSWGAGKATATVVHGIAAIPHWGVNQAFDGVQLAPLDGSTPVTLVVNAGETYLGSTGSGIVVARALQSGDYGTDVVLRRDGQPDQLLAHLAQGTVSAADADQDGMALAYGDPLPHVYVFDFPGAAVNDLNTDAADASAARLSFLTPTLVGWVGGPGYTTLVWEARSGGPQQRLTVGSPSGFQPGAFAVSGGTVAWTHTAADGVLDLEPADGSGPAVAVAGLDVIGPPQALSGGGFSVYATDTTGAAGLYQVATDGTWSLLEPVTPNPAKLTSLTLGSGRLVVDDTSTSSETSLWSRPISGSGGTLQYGAQRLVASDAASQPQTLLSGPRTAYLTPSSGTRLIKVLDDGAVEQSLPLASGATATLVALSGDHLLYATSNTSQWHVLNTVAGTITDVPAGSALWGRYLTEKTANPGEIVRLDLDAPTSSTNPFQLRAPDGCFLQWAESWGPWLAYWCSGNGINGSEIRNTDTGTVIPLTPDQRFGRLGDGVYAWKGAAGDGTNDVRVMDLRAPGNPTTILGTVATPINGTKWSLDPSTGLVAWEDLDGEATIASSGTSLSAPALLDEQTPAFVTPNGDGNADTWPVSFDLSRPASWTLTITDPTGRVVRSFAGNGAGSSGEASWDARDSGGKAVPDAVYTWTLTLSTPDAQTANTTGTVAVQLSPAPPAPITAPATSGTPRRGSTLTCNRGRWMGLPVLTNQWLRNGRPIVGATKLRYKLVTADIRQAIACRVTATNAFGTRRATTPSVKPST